jgi:hypothetical protein
MTMVRFVELILDQNPPIIFGRVFAENIRSEWADFLFLCLDFEVEAKRFAKKLDVHLSR